MVILRHLLQPMVRLLLRLAVVIIVVVVVVVVVAVAHLPLEIILLHCQSQHLILNQCQQPEFH